MTETNSQEAKELIFPGGMRESQLYKSRADAVGKAVVGASCVQDDSASKMYDDWVYLPSIHAPDFQDELKRVIENHHIISIFCPHAFVYKTLLDISKTSEVEIKFSNPPPWKTEVSDIKYYYGIAKVVRELATRLRGEDEQGLPCLEEIAGMLMFSQVIPGMTSDEKLAAFISIYPDLSKGDIVEIGAYWGRSSYFLAWASRKYKIGNLLVVDPWSQDESQQKDSPEIMHNSEGEIIKWEPVFEGFLAALSPFTEGVNYLRMPSVEGAKIYRENKNVKSSTFGETTYSGNISLIHIDGNHDYEMVVNDCKTWLDLVQSGGWIVFDDYIWVHGDGPRRAGDEFLRENSGQIDRSFVCDKSLFIRLR